MNRVFQIRCQQAGAKPFQAQAQLACLHAWWSAEFDCSPVLSCDWSLRFMRVILLSLVTICEYLLYAEQLVLPDTSVPKTRLLLLYLMNMH